MNGEDSASSKKSFAGHGVDSGEQEGADDGSFAARPNISSEKKTKTKTKTSC